jgi:hypothetical protein
LRGSIGGFAERERKIGLRGKPQLNGCCWVLKLWVERFQTDERRKLQLNGRCWDLESWLERFQVVEGKPELCGCCWVLKNLFGFRGFKQVE